MKRNVDINDISDGNLYNADSLVKISCNDCQGCDKCCHNMGDSIILDPYDMYELSKGTGKAAGELISDEIELGVVDGVILPHIKMIVKGLDENDGSCKFLVNGRCSIHSFRPGFCRLFPLGRIYNEDSTYSYFNQIYECNHPVKSKIKVKKWIDIPNFGRYEKFISKWHDLLMRVEEKMATYSQEDIKNINMQILTVLYLTPYSSEDFYDEFDNRHAEIIGKFNL